MLQMVVFWSIMRNTIEKYNLEDPRQLFREGKWTWDTMMEMMKTFSDPNDIQGGQFGRYGITSWDPLYSLHTSCGVPMVSMDSKGVMKNNLADPAIERVMNWGAEMIKTQVAFPRWENEWANAEDRVTSGMMLFFVTGLWDYPRFTNGALAMGEKASYVPYPKDPNTDKYYRIPGIDAYMIVGAAKNLEGCSAWLDCHLTVNTDEQIKEENHKRWVEMDPEKQGLGYSQDDVDFFYEMTDLDSFEPIIDWSNSIVSDGGIAATQKVWLQGIPLATKREEAIPQFDEKINEWNQRVR